MKNKKCEAELVKTLQKYTRLIGERVTHIKTGRRYEILGINLREADMSIEFLYGTVTVHGELRFTRPISELFDGRFALPVGVTDPAG